MDSAAFLAMHGTSTRELVSAYLDVVNRAIAQNRDRVPYKQIVATGARLLGDRFIDIVVVGSEERELGRFTIELAGERLVFADAGARTDRGAEHGAGGVRHAELEWKVRSEHLEHVVSDPYPYVESPLKLDIDWLRTRVAR